ncbi:MAG: hpch/hpai aldolase, partial [Alphaproteobacteria bacterium]|nr:hpch/hpai aldolase [Alphaproteobacteria bacterium]
MPTVTLRSLIGSSETKVGTFLFEFATPGIGQILKAAGAAYAVLDMEHTGFG